MRFLVDECTDPIVVKWMQEKGYSVCSIYDEYRGATDDEVLEKAQTEGWILITNDKDFGEKIYKENRLHQGVVFLRLDDERAKNKIAVLSSFLDDYAHHIEENFIVVTEKQVRFAKR